MSFLNRVLTIMIHLSTAVTGRADIHSHIKGYPAEGLAGIARSEVIVRKWFLRMYHMRGEYVLSPDGTSVSVHLWEQFGPIGFLFQNNKDATARIGPGGITSTYHMPLLGGEWTGKYQVSADRNSLVAVYECPWGRAQENITRERV